MRTFTLLFGLTFVSYLSGIALAQGKAGTHAPDSAHGIDHDRDADHNKTHGTDLSLVLVQRDASSRRRCASPSHCANFSSFAA
jgi:hypothetical protein